MKGEIANGELIAEKNAENAALWATRNGFVKAEAKEEINAS